MIVACDGSHTDGRAGWGWIALGGVSFDFGSVDPAQHAEASAIREVLRVFPDRPLTVLTDCDEVQLRLVKRTPSKPRARHGTLWAALLGEVNGADFQDVRPDNQATPLHSAAHYLAYLGREGRSPRDFDPTSGIARIFASDRPEETAHRLVHEDIFRAS